MARKASRRQIHALSGGLCLIALAMIAYWNAWWPGVMLAIGLPLALRQYLMGRNYDMWISIVVFCGVFITVQFDIHWEVLLPVLLAIGGVYILFREYIESKQESEADREEDLNQEISEKKRRK